MLDTNDPSSFPGGVENLERTGVHPRLLEGIPIEDVYAALQGNRSVRDIVAIRNELGLPVITGLSTTRTQHIIAKKALQAKKAIAARRTKTLVNPKSYDREQRKPASRVGVAPTPRPIVQGLDLATPVENVEELAWDPPTPMILETPPAPVVLPPPPTTTAAPIPIINTTSEQGGQMRIDAVVAPGPGASSAKLRGFARYRMGHRLPAKVLRWGYRNRVKKPVSAAARERIAQWGATNGPIMAEAWRIAKSQGRTRPNYQDYLQAGGRPGKKRGRNLLGRR